MFGTPNIILCCVGMYYEKRFVTNASISHQREFFVDLHRFKILVTHFDNWILNSDFIVMDRLVNSLERWSIIVYPIGLYHKKIQYKTLIPWSLPCQLEFPVGLHRFKVLVTHFDNSMPNSDFKVLYRLGNSFEISSIILIHNGLYQEKDPIQKHQSLGAFLVN